jgi:hypothetical protein
MDELLHWRSLSRVVENRKAPSNFLRNLLYGGAPETHSTNRIEIGKLTNTRAIAEFVKRGGDAVVVERDAESTATIEPAHIRIKMPLSPTDVISRRRAGSALYVTPQEHGAAIARFLAREVDTIMRPVDEAEEWMAAMSLRGAISYSGTKDSWTIDFDRANAHDVDPGSGAYWDETDFTGGDTSDPAQLFEDISLLINEAEGLQVTDVILGTEAARWFKIHPRVTALLDPRRLITGGIDLTQQWTNGALFLGSLTNGIRIWCYARTTLVGSTVTPLIRPKYAEFVCATPQAEFTRHYGAVQDWDVFSESEGFAPMERFMKTYLQPEPSIMYKILETNPIFVPGRPNCTASAKVVSG